MICEIILFENNTSLEDSLDNFFSSKKIIEAETFINSDLLYYISPTFSGVDSIAPSGESTRGVSPSGPVFFNKHSATKLKLLIQSWKNIFSTMDSQFQLMEVGYQYTDGEDMEDGLISFNKPDVLNQLTNFLTFVEKLENSPYVLCIIGI